VVFILTRSTAPQLKFFYEGEPFLRFLEFYVLGAIGELSPSQKHFLDETTPKLREIYGRHGDWHAIVEGVMDFPPHLPEKIRELWTHNSEKAHANGVVLPPQVFAEAVVDQNLIR
jgi:hypothetical protein